MQGPPIPLFKSGGDPLLHGENLPQRCPAFIDVLGLEFPAQSLDGLIGKHRDKQVSLGPVFLVMVDGAQPQFRFQTAEDRLQVGQHGIGLPQGSLIPVLLIGSQAVDTRMGQLRAGNRHPLPGQRGYLGAGFIRG